MESILSQRRYSAIGNQRKQAILDFIRSYRGKHDYSPALWEIAEAVTGKREDAGNVSVWVRQLVSEGFLVRGAKGARTLTLANPQPRERYEE